MHDSVKEYYGTILANSSDLKTDACCTESTIPSHIRDVLSLIHDEVISKYYGCGLVAPQSLEGMKILDLGCGTGRDCFVLSKMVGEKGMVVGIDMTEEQLEVANRHVDYHMDRFGYSEQNVKFIKGYIEKLDKLGFDENSFDIIVSNCVINLSPDKESVLKGAYRLLKPGGEVYFSDVYSNSRVPEKLSRDKVLYGECLGGALYWNDFIGLAKKTGFTDPRLFEDRPIEIDNDDIKRLISHIDFYSATYRLFKLNDLETHCEDYGQAVTYRGTIADNSESFVLDKHHTFYRGKVIPVCGNTYRMLNETRFREHFEFIGKWDKHYGIFDGCGTTIPFGTDRKPTGDGCC